MKKVKIGCPLEYEDEEHIIRNGVFLRENEVEAVNKKLKQFETYENIRKELIKEFNFYETTEWGIKGYEILEKFRNILNKVGGSDE